MQRRWRLKRNADFQALRQNGRTQQNHALMTSTRLNGLTHNRYGFVVGKRIGKAVVRNRLKRQMREAMRSIHPHLTAGYDVVLIARGGILKLDYWQLRDTLIAQVKRLGLWG